ncbi:hypothetical protein HA402_002597 [Bradysia odoriphaga]|nr:hypothetical protein HA402_002597 [Bradysia odoriphaga]
MQSVLYIEDQQLTLPTIENGVYRLGDLFNCRTGKRRGFNLFGRNLQKDHVCTSPISDTSYTLTLVKSASDKMKSLEVSGNLSLEILAGLIKVEGSAECDSSNTNASQTEILSCDYRFDGYQVDLLPSARDVIDPVVKKLIMMNEICVTHVVKGVVVGGKLNAKISISKNDVKQRQGIKESCLGKLVYGKINASVEANLKMLDSDESSCFNKHITIRSTPSVDDQQPISIDEMFRVIGNFPSAIDQETPYTDWDAKIKGVPIKFLLVPIAQFLNYKVEKIYAQLEDDIFQRFKNLLLNVQDYSSPGYVERQIIDRREDVSPLLMNDHSIIPVMVSKYGEELRSKANEVYVKAVSLLKKYRCGTVTPDEMLKYLIDSEKSVNQYEVLRKINSFHEAAQNELLGMHHDGSSKSKHIQVFTDKTSLLEWFSSESGCKILVQTQDQQQDVFHKFNVLSQELCDFGFEVAVSVPSASQNFSLSIKLYNHVKEYQSDIGYILRILKCAVSRGTDADYEFFNLYSNIFHVSLPLEPKDICNINTLIGNLDGYQNVYMATSPLDILAKMNSSSADLSFFIPIEAFETSFDAVSALTRLHPKYSNVDWIVGPFLQDQLVAPMLLIFRGRSLLATCFDHLDLLYLDHIWSNKNTNGDMSHDFSILSTENYRHTFHGDRLEYVKELLTILNDTKALGQLSEAKFWNSLNLTVNECARDVILLLRAAARNDQLLFRQYLTAAVFRKVPALPLQNVEDVPQLIAKLKGWLKRRDPIMAQVYEIDSLIRDNKDVEESVEVENDGESHLYSAVIELIEHVDIPRSIRDVYGTYKNSRPDFLISKIKEATQLLILNQTGGDDILYVRKLIESFNDCNATLQQDVLISLCQGIGLADDELKRLQNLIRNRLYRNAAAAVSIHKYGSSMLQFDAHMSKMYDIHSHQSLSDAVTESEFIKSAELWRNAKFLYLVRENLKAEPFLRNIVAYFNYTTPEYIPPDVKTVLDKIAREYKEFEFPSSIESLQDFESFLYSILRLKGGTGIPPEFRKFLTDVIGGNQNLQAKLHQLGALPHWNFSEHRFDSLWDFDDIQHVLTKLSNHEDASEEATQHPAHDLISLKDDLNVQTDLPIRKKGVINVKEPFNAIFGDSLKIIGNADFVKITKLISKPTFNSRNIRGYGSILLPYLLQQIKMLGCDNLLAEDMYQLIDVDAVDPSLTDESEQTAGDSADIFSMFDDDANAMDTTAPSDCVPISRLDCLTGLLSITDITVAQDIVRNIAQFSMSMPLVIHNIDKNDGAAFKFLLPFFVGLKIKWEQQHGSIAENFLFKSPFKLILAVRMGTPTQSGKSSILNQVLVCRKTKNMFASKSSPGNEFGPAVTLPGTVEFIWLTEETADKTLWETLRPHYCDRKDSPLILLANLHGNVWDYSDTVKLLAPITSAYIVFVMATVNSTAATVKADCDRFTEIVGNKVKVAVAIVDPFHNNNNDSIIRSSQLVNEGTLKNVRKLIKSTITSTAITYDNTIVTQSRVFSAMESIETIEASQVINVAARYGPMEIRQALQLQRGFASAQEGKSKWERCPLLQEIIYSFCNVLRLPRNKRMEALLHLESEVGAMSNEQSKSLRNEILRQKKELQKIVFIKEQSTQVENLKRTIRSTQNQLNNITLGLEHFYRELAQIYFINLALRPSTENKNFIFEAPEKYAELLIDGHAIEILDGDACTLHQLWLMQIFHQVSIKKPNLKIFVVTIVGLQSSGKSTLLNALFACRFAVSVGRCTRGLFARLLFLDDDVRNEFNIGADAILLIDTEGLGAPEMMNDPYNTKKDRKLATFAMGISGLTIINVLGEYMTDLTDILQIAIIAMARLEISGMSPDIMVVQHYLTERNTNMVATAIDGFNTALNNAIAVTENSDDNIGIRSAKCLQKMFRRLQSGEILKGFSPYKDGATANSSPSKQYQNDVVNLYKSILRCCQESGQIIEFQAWYELLVSFWSSVATEDFAVNFKNLKELQQFMTLSKLVAQSKEAVDLAFRHHGGHIEAYLNVKISSDPSPSINRESILNDVKRYVDKMPDICMDERLNTASSLCVKCSEVVKEYNKLRDYIESHAKQYKNETINTIYEYKRDMRSSIFTYFTQRYDAMLIKNESCDEFSRKVDEILKLKLVRNATYSKEEIAEIENEIWISLKRIASSRQIMTMVENTIREEVRDIYEKRNIDIYNAYNGSNETSFYDMKAIVKYKYKYTKLEDKHKRWLRERANEIVENHLINFDTGMVKSFVRTAATSIETNILKKFKDIYKVTLDGKFTSQYTAHVLKIFKLHMLKLEKVWKKSNDPMEILEMKKDYYMTMIRTRLRHGFSYYGDGRIAREDVLSAITEISTKFANDARVNNLLGVDWFACSESIRLKYFKKLIDDIKGGNMETGAQYFGNPQRYFKEWFKQQTDTCANNDIALSAFIETFQRECNRFEQNIRNNEDNAEVILSIIAEILLRTGKEYKQSRDFRQGLSKNLASFTDGLLDGFKNVVPKESFDNIQLSLLSEDSIVLKRIGCTRSCRFCGAMCMGAHGHDKDTGNTKMHHTLHQPEGLAGTHGKHTKVLVARSCNVEVDSNCWYEGEEKTTWGEIKEKDWLYIQSSRKIEFGGLMIWFFKELQSEIAARSKLIAVPSSEMANLGWNNIASIDEIVAGIESALSGA